MGIRTGVLNENTRSRGEWPESVDQDDDLVSDMTLWARVDSDHATFFGAHRPARTVVITRTLHFGFQIEIESVAAVGSEHV